MTNAIVLTFTAAVAALAAADKALDKATAVKVAKVKAAAPLYLAEVKAAGGDETKPKLAFRLTYMMAHSGKDVGTVNAWLADEAIVKRLAKGDKGTPMHRAYNAAKVSLMRVRDEAGLKAKPAPKAEPVTPAPAEAPAPVAISVKEFVAETCPTTIGLLEQVDLFAAALSHLQKKNAKTATGELGSAITRAIVEFCANVSAAHKIVESEAATETVHVAEPAKPAKAKRAKVNEVALAA